VTVLYELFRGADWPAPTAESRFTPAEVAGLVREDRGTLPPPLPLWTVEIRCQYGAYRTGWIRRSEHDSQASALDRAAISAARPHTVAVRVVRYAPAEVTELPGMAAAEVTS